MRCDALDLYRAPVIICSLVFMPPGCVAFWLSCPQAVYGGGACSCGQPSLLFCVLEWRGIRFWGPHSLAFLASQKYIEALILVDSWAVEVCV